MKKIPKRIEITITKVDDDIKAFLQETEIPNATLFKTALRAYMSKQEEEKLDMRIKRLLEEVLLNSPLTSPIKQTYQTLSPSPEKVETVNPTKSRLGFVAKKT